MAGSEIQSDEVNFQCDFEEVQRYTNVVYVYCDPCNEDGESSEAGGFCVNCNQYLCCECFRAHRKNKMSKDHHLKDKADMPAVRPQGTHEVEKCSSHDKEILKHFCVSHDQALCNLCKEIDHRKCDNVVALADISHEKTKAVEVKRTIDELDEIQKQLHVNLCIAKQNKTDSGVYYQNILMIRDNDLKMMTAIETGCGTLTSQISNIKKDFDRVENNVTPKFLMQLRAKGELTILKKRLAAIKSDNQITRYCFKPQTDAKHSNIIGMFYKCPHKIEEVGMKTASDVKSCMITGIETLSDNRLVVLDKENLKIKLVDKTGRNDILELKLEFRPWDITKIDDKRIAVTTYNDKKILLVSITDTITVQKTIDKSQFSYCQGIVFCNETLFVSYYSPNQIEILNLEGNVQQTIDKTNRDGNSRFGDPEYVTSNPYTNTLYLSDRTNKCIHCLSLDGQIMSSFKHEQLKEPKGISAGRNGRIFVCSYGSDRIFEITYDFSEGHILLDSAHGISKPHSIKYYDKECKLFVGSANKDTIQVFLV